MLEDKLDWRSHNLCLQVKDNVDWLLNFCYGAPFFIHLQCSHLWCVGPPWNICGVVFTMDQCARSLSNMYMPRTVCNCYLCIYYNFIAIYSLEWRFFGSFYKNVRNSCCSARLYRNYRRWLAPDIFTLSFKMKWNESGFRPPLCTYRLNWARRTSWGWWDDRDDTVLQTQDSKFEAWRSEAEHATSRLRRLSTILTFTRGWGRNIFFKPPRPGTEPRTLAWKAAVLTTTLGPPPLSFKRCLAYSVRS